MSRIVPDLNALAFATDLDVLPDESVIEDRGDYVLVASPDNPTYHWGNFLLYRSLPGPGAREAWEAAFEREIGERNHRLFAWDGTDAQLGTAQQEFIDAGYTIEHVSTLVARPDELQLHDRASDAVVRRLDPRAGGADDDVWREVIELQMANRGGGHTEAEFREFLEASARQRRRMFTMGRSGGWYVAVLADGTVVATCGIVVVDGRARYQYVDTHVEHRRRGHARRLVHDVGRDAIDRAGAEQLVIVADVAYHAKALYESLGFVERQQSVGVCWFPGAPDAARHPRLGARARRSTS